tara:strand:- start:334 stop:2220 length:1887 start_codon:yes stop_codon:yes gene_type:complete
MKALQWKRKKLKDIFNMPLSQNNILKFITCGSVDDGKSTLIGRLLYDSQLIASDQLNKLKNDSIKEGTQGKEIDFSLLVDGLSAEREQGITIDVAHRYFNTKKRKFIVLDTPGHEQYTRNMATGASSADVAIILIDASKGVLPQTKRHSYLCFMMGIKEIIVAINKIDQINYNEDKFKTIESDYSLFAKKIGFKKIKIIPISALQGDNVINKSKKMKWYKGKSILDHLENINLKESEKFSKFRLPIQSVLRPNSNFRGFQGTISSGKINKGDKVLIQPGNTKSFIKDIIYSANYVKTACVGQAITVLLKDEVDISRGNLITKHDEPSEISNQFQVNLIWMDDNEGHTGRSYFLKMNNQTVGSQITSIKSIININDLSEKPAKLLKLNDIAKVNINLDRKVVFETFKDNPIMGSFILIDRYTNKTIAAGTINFALRRSQNIFEQNLSITKNLRHEMNLHKSKVYWFTGISGSGKSTIANLLEKKLYDKGIRTYILDGDNIRHGLNKDLGFTDHDRIENIRRVSEVTKLMVDAGIVVITSFISPFKSERDYARSLFDENEFVEIFLDVPFSVAEKRDPKGLYKKAKQGKIKNFTGIDSLYEKPANPEYKFETDKLSANKIVSQILDNEFI